MVDHPEIAAGGVGAKCEGILREGALRRFQAGEPAVGGGFGVAEAGGQVAGLVELVEDVFGEVVDVDGAAGFVDGDAVGFEAAGGRGEFVGAEGGEVDGVAGGVELLDRVAAVIVDVDAFVGGVDGDPPGEVEAAGEGGGGVVGGGGGRGEGEEGGGGEEGEGDGGAAGCGRTGALAMEAGGTDGEGTADAGAERAAALVRSRVEVPSWGVHSISPCP